MWRLRKLGGLVVAAFLLGCSQSPDTIADENSSGMSMPAPIAQMMRPTVAIRELSPDLVGESIRVEGTVQQLAPLLEGTLYQVADAGGAVWIFSAAAPPEVGATVAVEGILQYEQIVVSGADISEYYLQEQARSRTNGDRLEEAN